MAICLRIGNRSSPFFVNVYSTRGGFSANVFLLITPKHSRSSSRAESVLGLIEQSELSNSPNRFDPLARSRRMSGVHLLPIIFVVRATHPSLVSILFGSSFIYYFTMYSNGSILNYYTKYIIKGVA